MYEIYDHHADRYDALLEDEHGFTRQVVQTDYEFTSRDEAADLCGFFFGKETGDRIAADFAAQSPANGVIMPEYTGIWTRR